MKRQLASVLAVWATAIALPCVAAPEARFAEAIDQLAAGQRDDALRILQELNETEPEFGLGQQFLGEVQQRRTATATELAALAEEGRIRLSSEQATPVEGTIPDAVLQVAPVFQYLIAVDLPRARLYVLENRDDGLHVVRSHYAAMGKQGWGKRVEGDQRTPVGIYHVTGWIDDTELPPLYGAGAYPLDYPNIWDRIQQRTGSGIWLHGVPNVTGARAPRSSQGCVTMANDDLRALQPYIANGRTPVLLSDDLRWLPPEQVQTEREAFAARIEHWRQAAATNDADAYLELYAAHFTAADGSDYDSFAERTRAHADTAPPPREIEVESLSVFRYPGSEDKLVLAELSLQIRDENGAQTARKQLFWTLDGDGQWRILREEER